jgi:hypothetical protein
VKYKNSPELTQASLDELTEFFGCHTTEIIKLDKEDRVELEILLATLWGYN